MVIQSSETSLPCILSISVHVHHYFDWFSTSSDSKGLTNISDTVDLLICSVTSINNCCKPNSRHNTNQCIGNTCTYFQWRIVRVLCARRSWVGNFQQMNPKQELLSFLFWLRPYSVPTVMFTCRAVLMEVQSELLHSWNDSTALDGLSVSGLVLDDCITDDTVLPDVWRWLRRPIGNH